MIEPIPKRDLLPKLSINSQYQSYAPGSEISPYDSNRLFILLFMLILKRLEDMVLSEFETFYSTCISQARAFDEAYLAQVDKFKEAVSSKFDEIMRELWSKIGQ